MAKYKFEYDDSEVLRKVCHEVETYGNLDEVLKEIKLFLKAITYQTYRILSIKNEKEYDAVEEFLEKYRKNSDG